jgi:hypothetical protein
MHCLGHLSARKLALGVPTLSAWLAADDPSLVCLVPAGSVKVSIVSKGAKDAGLLLKTVSKPIKALSECPSSPCQPPAAPATPATPATPAPATLNLTGNPMVDMMSVFSMMYGAANAGQNPLGAVLNFNTAMTVISGALHRMQITCSALIAPGQARHCQ